MTHATGVPLLLCLFSLPGASLANASFANAKHMALETLTMSAGETVVLFRLRVYRDEIFPAYQAFHVRRETGPLVRLLTRARPIAREAPSLSDREQAQRLINSLFEEALRAKARGDPVPAQEYAARADALFRPPAPDLITRAEIDTAILALRNGNPGTYIQLDRLVEGTVVPGLVDLLCIPWDRVAVPVQPVIYSLLNEYLETRSEWLREHLLYGDYSGPELEGPVGPPIGLYTRQDLEGLRRELALVQRPASPGPLQQDFDNLRALVDIALKDPDLVLAYMMAR